MTTPITIVLLLSRSITPDRGWPFDLHDPPIHSISTLFRRCLLRLKFHADLLDLGTFFRGTFKDL